MPLFGITDGDVSYLNNTQNLIDEDSGIIEECDSFEKILSHNFVE